MAESTGPRKRKAKPKNVEVVEGKTPNAESLTTPTPKVANKPDYRQSFFAKIGVGYCKNCGSKRVRHVDGSIVQCCANPVFK